MLTPINSLKHLPMVEQFAPRLSPSNTRQVAVEWRLNLLIVQVQVPVSNCRDCEVVSMSTMVHTVTVVRQDILKQSDMECRYISFHKRL